ncbi:MAG: triose-phosphate isomerase [Clostridiaceae bacterium]|jgi:triosephosphate isomerase|nr:triose-phosphate isomerase [Clostridiaceae bacterium]
MLKNPILKAPFFEIGPKTYLYGEDLMQLALDVDAAAAKYGVQVIFTAPFADIYRISQATDNLIVLAPHMDAIRPGRGVADILPEAVKAAGAQGVMLNHAEKPLTYSQIKATIERAEELDLLTVVCSDSIAEAKSVALLNPDVIVAEPTELIGTGQSSDLSYVKATLEVIHGVNPNILVLQGAGISGPEDVYKVIEAGADATGSSSSVCLAENPGEMATAMIAAARKAWDQAN